MRETSSLLLNKYPNTTQVLNVNDEDESVCFGYKFSIIKQIITFLLVLLSCGMLILVFYWKPEWKVFLTCSQTPVKDAQVLLIQDSNKRYFVVDITTLTFDEFQSSQDTAGGYQSSAVSSRLSVADDFDQQTSNGYGSRNGIAEHHHHLTQSEQASSGPSGIIANRKATRFFVFQALRYVWDNETNSFKKIRGFDYDTPCVDLLKNFNGQSAQNQSLCLKYYGQNSIEVEVKSYGRLFVEEILTPFYIFQILACALWMVDQYYYYAFCIIVISLISMILSLVETKRQSVTLHDMVKSRLVVSVCRAKDVFEQIPAEQLVPGDVIEIPGAHESTMACDAILLNGNCIVNESMLTGESVPVIKTPLPYPENLNEHYDVEAHKRHTLFNGTRIVQTRNYDSSRVLAVVVRTGFSTSKGDLVRSILFPKPMGFKFYQDSMRFILFLFLIALVGMTYGTITLALKGIRVYDLVMRALDIVTIVVPPALPAAMTVGTVYAQSRLKKRSIYCISPPRINVCGKLKLICFDKTGTLTEDGLDMWGVIPVDQHYNLQQPVHHVPDLPNGSLLKSLATCHSLTRFDGSLTGDPLDVKMFEATEWTFIDEQVAGTCKFEQVTPIVRQKKQQHKGGEGESSLEIAIIKQYTFSSSLLRMTVLCKTLGNDHLEVFTKGAPEKIIELCKEETVPKNFNQHLHMYTANGYRVIALAGKRLDPSVSWNAGSQLPRDSIESGLDFYGFLIMQNMMKPETAPVISELNKAQITSVMVTGDNLLTALCIARKCGMVPKNNKVVLVEAHAAQEPSDASKGSGVPARIEWKVAENFSDIEEQSTSDQGYQGYQNVQTSVDIENSLDSYNFAMTGKTFGILRKSFPKIFEKILVNGTVYARMSPDQKAQLVEHLISLGYCVSMCGDGANDCGALKAAHVGISLSEAEASVAAPFTSKIQNISCVPEVIKEGRAALVTSFGVFKYMALYSMIQFSSVLILYTFFTNLADQQFLYIDLFLITPVAVFMSANKAYDKIAIRRPLGSLVGFVNISSIIFQVLLVIVFQIFALVYLLQQSWYKPPPHDTEHFKDNIKCQETTVIFLVSTYMYVSMAYVYSKGPPYRRPITDNIPFVFSLVILTACNLWLTISPLEIFSKILMMVPLDPDHTVSFFRFSLVALAVIFFAVSYITEEVIVDSAWFKTLGRKIVRKKQPKNKYKMVKSEVQKDSQWPYLGRITFSDEARFQ